MPLWIAIALSRTARRARRTHPVLGGSESSEGKTLSWFGPKRTSNARSTPAQAETVTDETPIRVGSTSSGTIVGPSFYRFDEYIPVITRLD